MKITQGATGKVILAALEPERQRELLERVPRSERVSLDQALLAAKRNGYASSRGEIIKGSVAAAAPYFDHSGQVIGSVGLFGPDARVSDAKLTQNFLDWLSLPLNKSQIYLALTADLRFSKDEH